jgi:DUF971 family protein
MQIHPVQIERQAGKRLLITWSDGQRRSYTYREIQDNCPCANCREKRRKPAEPAQVLPVISPQEAQPLEILGMQPVGQYAYHIKFNQGCDTGIFTFELLRQLGSEA